MAKKAAPIAPPVAAPAVKPLKTAPAAPQQEYASLEARVSELEADLVRIAKLCGQVWGEPLASAALEIVTKRQGAK